MEDDAIGVEAAVTSDAAFFGTRRPWMRVIFAVLEGAEAKETRTGIMFRARLNNAMLQRYLDGLAERGFVTITPDGRYELTQPGAALKRDIRRVLSHFDDNKKRR